MFLKFLWVCWKILKNFGGKRNTFEIFNSEKFIVVVVGSKIKKCAESKISKVFSFPPTFFNIFFHTHKNFKNIIGKCRDNFQIFRFAYEHFHLNNGFGLLLVRILVRMRKFLKLQSCSTGSKEHADQFWWNSDDYAKRYEPSKTYKHRYIKICHKNDSHARTKNLKIFGIFR